MKPKMNCDFALRRLSEAKNELRFAFSRLREAKNELRFAFPRPREAKNELRFAFPEPRKAKNELRFRFPESPEGQNELRFRFPEPPESQNELRFCFPECPETQKRIAILLPGVSGDAKTNCDFASRSTRRRKKESQLGFAERRGNAKGIAIPMQCASCIREISYGKASWSGGDSQKELRFLCSVSSMFERRVAVWLHGVSEVSERERCGASWRGGGKKRERGEACAGVGR